MSHVAIAHQLNRASTALDPHRVEDQHALQEPQARSLFGEILDWMLAPLLLLWPMSIAVTYLIAQSIANAPFDRSLEDNINMLARQIEVHAGQPQLVFNAQARDMLRANDTDQLFFQILSKNHQWIAGERDLPHPASASIKPHQVAYRDDLLHGEPVRVAFKNVTLPTPENLSVIIQIAETNNKREQLANEIIKGVILPQFVILPISVILVWFALTRGIAPLRQLQVQIRNRRPDDLSPIPAHAAPDEVAPLVLAFNELLQRQSQVLQQQKRFIADAAHQMRTPLAGLRTQTELALRLKDPKEIESSLQQLLTSTKQATRLINQLLSMARAENQNPATEPLPLIALDHVAREVVRDWVPQAMQKQIDLGLELDGKKMMIHGHALLLRELLNNLLDNAIRFTPAQGRITVRIHRKNPDAITLEVEDTGPGIPSHEYDLVFERFYRVLGTGVDGSGLGLAIVREIAQRHQATISLHNNPHSNDPHKPGTMIRIAFPSKDLYIATLLDDAL